MGTKWYTDGPVNPPEYKEDDYCAECEAYQCIHIEYADEGEYDTVKEWRGEA